MSDLSGKFASFEEQSATQHTELMDALNTIAFALGAPPTTPTTNLGDILTALNTLNDTLSAILTANGGYYVSSLNTLDLINIGIDTQLNNNSLNAQRIIAAIYATFCDCTTDTPLLGPPLDVTPTEIVNDAKCRRIQFYLSVFGNWLNKIANYGASGASITGGTLAYLLSVAAADAGLVATGAEVGAAGGIPGVVVGAVVGLIVVAIYTFGGSVLIDYANQFNDATLRDNMVMAMYAATNADEGYTAFKTTLLAGMSTIPAEIIYTLWWGAWSNDIYSGVPTVDDSAFDGSICAPAEPQCYEFTAVATHMIAHPSSGGGGGELDLYTIPWTSPFTFSSITFDGVVECNQPFMNRTDLFGWRIRCTSGSATMSTQFEGVHDITSDVWTVDVHTTEINVYNTNSAFTIEICQPLL